jgi:hypothetical protein
MIRTDDIIVFEKKIDVVFTLELSNEGELTLINHVKNYAYKPADRNYNFSNYKNIFLSNQNLEFSVIDIFNLIEPEIIVNNENIKFTREKTRRELEEELDNFGSEQLNTRQLIKKLELVERKLDDKYNSSMAIVGNSNTLFHDFNRKFEENFVQLEKEIGLIKELKFEDIGKIIGKVDLTTKDKKDEKLADARPLSELDIQFQHIKGFKRFCVGIKNGCTCNGSLWGSNPYTTGDGDNYCKAAYHSEIIDENGGVFEVKLIGQYPNYTASTKNGITSYDYGSYTGYSIHFAETNIDTKDYTTCRNI